MTVPRAQGKAITIGGRTVGGGAPCLLIAEVAQAHDGSLGLAHSFIDAAAAAGADAVKFQTHIAAAESTLDEPFRVKFSFADKTRFDYWRRMEFTAEEWAGLADHARDRDLVFLSSPFSEEAVDLLHRLDMAAWKIASGEIFNPLLLRRVLAAGGPVLFSTGLCTLDELAAAAAPFRDAGREIAVFQCTSEYPVPLEKVGLNVIDLLADRFACPAGLSDHSGTPFPALAAMARGAAMIEAHLAFDKRMFGPDAPSSLTVAEFSELARARDAFHAMLAHPVAKDEMVPGRGDMRRMFSRSIALSRDMAAGETIAAADLTLKKPGSGIDASRLDEIVGRRLARDVPAMRLLREEDLE